MSRTRIAAVVALVVLGGCVGPLGGGSTDATSTPGVADGDATDGGGSGEPGGTSGTDGSGEPGGTDGGNATPAGIADGRVTNATALVETHRRALAGSSFVAELWANATVGGGETQTTASTHRVVRAAGGGTPYRATTNRTGTWQQSTRVTWSNGSVGLTREAQRGSDGEAVAFTREERPRPAVERPVIDDLAWLLRLGQFEATATSDDRLRTFAAVGRNETAASANNVTALSGEFAVDDAGRIRTATLSINRTVGGDVVHTEASFAVTRLGDVSVARPSWTGTALDRTPDLTIEAEVVDGRYVAVTHTGATTRPAGTSIDLEEGTLARSVEFERDFEPGDTVYLYLVDRDDGKRLALSRSKPSADATDLSGDYSVLIWRVDSDVPAVAAETSFEVP